MSSRVKFYGFKLLDLDIRHKLGVSVKWSIADFLTTGTNPYPSSSEIEGYLDNDLPWYTSAHLNSLGCAYLAKSRESILKDDTYIIYKESLNSPTLRQKLNRDLNTIAANLSQPKVDIRWYELDLDSVYIL